MTNNGAFYIPAEDKNDGESFFVPTDLAGETPEGTDNPSQASYNLEEHRKDIATGYYVHIHNGWDVDIKLVLYGSSYEDGEMRKEVIEQNNTELDPGDSVVFESDTGHSFLRLKVNNLIEAPTQSGAEALGLDGNLEVVFQGRYR